MYEFAVVTNIPLMVSEFPLNGKGGKKIYFRTCLGKSCARICAFALPFCHLFEANYYLRCLADYETHRQKYYQNFHYNIHISEEKNNY